MDWPDLVREPESGGWKLFAVVFLVAAAIPIVPRLTPSTFKEPFSKNYCNGSARRLGECLATPTGFEPVALRLGI